MSGVAVKVAAWVIAALALALAVETVVLLVAGGHSVGDLVTDWNMHGALTAAIFPLVGAAIITRRPDSLVAWLFLFVGFTQGLGTGFAAYAVYGGPRGWPAADVANWVTQWMWVPGVGTLVTYVFLLFPDGRPPSPRWRWFVAVAWVPIAALTVAAATTAWPPQTPVLIESDVPVLIGALFPLLGVTALACVASLIVRFRRSRGEERAQLKWVAYAASLVLVLLIVPFVQGYDGSWLQVLAIPLLPAAAGVAIVRYRLYDIDVVINKTLVYAVLGAFITGVYVAIVVGIGSAVGRGPNAALSIVATAIVAVAFQPVRLRVQRLANRIVYGQRAEPYEVLAGLANRMADAVSVEDVLPRMAEAAALAVGGERAMVTLALPGGGERSEVWPERAGSDGFDRTVTVTHQGRLVGAISVAKPRGQRLSKAEDELMSDLAAQAGVALYNVGLTVELQARLEHRSAQAEQVRRSRQRIVAARDAERRRMERDIHDGAQQQLVAMAVKLGLVGQLIGRDRVQALALLEDLGGDATTTLEGLRDLARGLYPPLLAERGLVEAIESHTQKHRLPARVHGTAAVTAQRFPEPVEVAAYFCCLEAIQNATKHAPGSDLAIELDLVADELVFSVTDAGPGFDPTVVQRGSGLQNMEDRVEALGGVLEIDSTPGRGTTVRCRIPLQLASAASHASTSASGPNADFAM